jgi:hypothetical protein
MRNTAGVGKAKVGRIVCKVSVGGGHMIWKTYLYTRHEWGEALAVHRPAAPRAQGLEDGTAYQLMGLGRWTMRNGESGGPQGQLSITLMLACQEVIVLA